MIRRFLDELTTALDLRAYGEPTIFSPAGVGGEANQGYDAFLPLIDSGISLYVWVRALFLAVVVFTCKHFDVDRAIETTRQFSAMERTVHHEF